MKRLLLTIVLFCSIIIAKAAVIIWDGGGGDGLWNTAVNWVGDVVPGAADDVILDNSALAGTYTVTLPGGAVTVAINSITITPLVANNITLILPNTNTANPGFSVTGTGDALILNIRAILINSSAAAAGSGISITNTFRINNGGHYVHKTGGGNAAIISQLSPVAGTELGEFEFDDPTGSTIISLSGRTFGTLTLSAVANSGIASYIGSGAVTCNVNGNLNINTGVSFAISMSADFVVKQNYNQAGSSTFNIQSSTNSNNIKVAGNVSTGGTITESNTGLPTFELNGTTNQQISGMGSLQNSITFLMNNPAGATLNSPLTLPYNLTLTSGKITTTSVNLLMMIDNATYTGGSAISFVNGPMKKQVMITLSFL